MQSNQKSERLEARITPEQKRQFQHAASSEASNYKLALIFTTAGLIITSP